jgi:hypothetical protein
MAKRCIPGVICIENMTFIFLTILFFVLAYSYYVLFLKIQPQKQTIVSSVPILLLRMQSTTMALPH